MCNGFGPKTEPKGNSSNLNAISVKIKQEKKIYMQNWTKEHKLKQVEASARLR